MSDHETTKQVVQDVPRKVFEKFLEELKNAGIAADIIERLKVAVLSDNNFSEQVIRNALFSDTQTL